jgi:hypothetical protein
VAISWELRPVAGQWNGGTLARALPWRGMHTEVLLAPRMCAMCFPEHVKDVTFFKRF